MYRPDVQQLRQFYGSPLGQLVRARLNAAIARWWPAIGGDTVLGLGYATPFLRPFLDQQDAAQSKENPLLIPAMPAAQGAVYWPGERANRTVLTEEFALPFADNYINRVLAVHSFEHAADAAGLLREIWRVLTPGGRLLVAVPNRRGWWTGAAATPFSLGRPYSLAQLRQLVCGDQFTLTNARTELFFLPSERRSIRKLGLLLEPEVRFLLGAFGGVVLLEAEKQIYASIKEPTRRVSKPVYVPVGSTPAVTRTSSNT